MSEFVDDMWCPWLFQIAEDAIRRAETSLREAENYVGREGRQALSQALEALKQFGKQSQQMTEIAQRAANESLKLVTFHSFLLFLSSSNCLEKVIISLSQMVHKESFLSYLFKYSWSTYIPKLEEKIKL